MQVRLHRALALREQAVADNKANDSWNTVWVEQHGLGVVERSFADVGSAVQVGMFPPLPLERFQQVGNAAGAGAKQMLVSAQRRRIAADIARRSEYIELTVYPAFASRFVEAMVCGTIRPL